MARRSDDSNVPRWIRYPVGLLAAAFVGPAVLGMLASVGFVLAPVGIVALPFILWGLSTSGTSETPHRTTARPRHMTRPVLQPT